MARLTEGEAIALVRRARGLTQAQLATRARLTRETVSRVEAGRIARDRSFDRLVRVLVRGDADLFAEAAALRAEQRRRTAGRARNAGT